MIIKRTNARELVLAVEEGRVELVERHFGKYLLKEAYGITLEGRRVALWREDEGGRRVVVFAKELGEGEARRLKEDMMRVGSFAQFAKLFFSLLDRPAVFQDR
jgi:hypothetical protein